MDDPLGTFTNAPLLYIIAVAALIAIMVFAILYALVAVSPPFFPLLWLMIRTWNYLTNHDVDFLLKCGAGLLEFAGFIGAAGFFFARVRTIVAAVIFSFYLVIMYAVGIYFALCKGTTDSWRNHIDIVWTAAFFIALAVGGYFLGCYFSRECGGKTDDKLADYFLSEKAPAAVRAVSRAIWRYWPASVVLISGAFAFAFQTVDSPWQHVAKEQKAKLDLEAQILAPYEQLDDYVNRAMSNVVPLDWKGREEKAQLERMDRDLDVLRREAALPADTTWLQSRKNDIRRLEVGQRATAEIFAGSQNAREAYSRLVMLRDEAGMIGRLIFDEAIYDAAPKPPFSNYGGFVEPNINLTYVRKLRDVEHLSDRAEALRLLLVDEWRVSGKPMLPEMGNSWPFYYFSYANWQIYHVLKIGTLGPLPPPRVEYTGPFAAKLWNLKELDYLACYGKQPNETTVSVTGDFDRLKYPQVGRYIALCIDLPQGS